MSEIKDAILSDGVISISGECKGCDDCVKVCPAGAITVNGLGTKHIIDPSLCVNCGQCLITCPFARIEDVSMVADVKAVMAAGKRVIVQEAPAVRVGLGEAFGMAEGSNVQGKMYAALRKLGFSEVYDTLFAADLTIMEEGFELIGRVNKAMGVEGNEEAGPLPQFTSCCPGWVRYAELNYPKLLPHLSTAKSPMMMQGAITKTYAAKKLEVPASDIYSVAIMPCTAKKFECSRPEFISSGYDDVDAVLTTRELAAWIKEEGIDFANLLEEEVDKLIGTGSGAGAIFGVTGGVMEAALRTAYAVLSGNELDNLDIEAVRGEEGLREATIPIPLKDGETLEVKVAVVNGTKYVDKVAQEVLEGTSPYHFIEVMNCSGGCVNGGGQPINHTTF